jgi:hypothetical protein
MITLNGQWPNAKVKWMSIGVIAKLIPDPKNSGDHWEFRTFPSVLLAEVYGTDAILSISGC